MATEKKTEQLISPLDQLKLKAWFEYLYEKTSSKALSELIKWMESRNVGEADENNLKWYKYEKCLRQPSDRTLTLIDSVVPGSLAVFNEGPEGLPLWNVLKGSKADCEAHLLRVLGHYKLFKLKMTLRQQCEAIFKLTVYENLIQDRNKDYEDKDLGVEFVGGFHSIEEVMAMPENMVAKSYELGRRVADTTKFKTALPLVFGQYKILNKNVVLSILALVHLCLASSDSEAKGIGYYLLDGITNRALKETFSLELNEYVLDNID